MDRRGLPLQVTIAEYMGVTRQRVEQIMRAEKIGPVNRKRIMAWLDESAVVEVATEANPADVLDRLRAEMRRRRYKNTEAAVEIGTTAQNIRNWLIGKFLPERGQEQKAILARIEAWIEASSREPEIPAKEVVVRRLEQEIKARGITKTRAAREMGWSPQNLNSFLHDYERCLGRDVSARILQWIAA
jgi:hypothetical protein